jgi:hypothetical protein
MDNNKNNQGNQTISFGFIAGLCIILVVLYLFSPDDTQYSTSYWSVVALLLLSIINIYLSVTYYIKLREEPGLPGIKGSKGYRGLKGDVGKCTFSKTCNIENCYNKVYSVANDLFPDLSKGNNGECLRNPNKCKTQIGRENSQMIKPQLNKIIEECKKTKESEEDFINKIKGTMVQMELSN